jgi:hypothetical protein
MDLPARWRDEALLYLDQHFLPFRQPRRLVLCDIKGCSAEYYPHDEQQKSIEYLRTEVQVLREKLGKKRILLSDDQRRRLAAKGKVLGRKVLDEIVTLFTPDTILRWHRQLVAKKWDHSDQPSLQGGCSYQRPSSPRQSSPPISKLKAA